LQKENSAGQSAYLSLDFGSGNHPEILLAAQLVRINPVFTEPEVSVLFFTSIGLFHSYMNPANLFWFIALKSI
jgi:hypothetical protein